MNGAAAIDRVFWPVTLFCENLYQNHAFLIFCVKIYDLQRVINLELATYGAAVISLFT